MTVTHETTAARKADREKIAKAAKAIAEQYGAVWTRRDEGRGIYLGFTINNAGAMMSISDLHERAGEQGGIISWYRLPPDFSRAVVGAAWTTNPTKCTSIGDWRQLLHYLEMGLAGLTEGGKTI